MYFMNKIRKVFCNEGSSVAYAIITIIFTIVPEECFKIFKISEKFTEANIILINRILLCLSIFIIANLIYYFYRKNRRQVSIEGNNFSNKIEIGNLFEVSNGKVVIDCDECFTTKVGEAPGDIKRESVCGQYLENHSIENILELIDQAGVKPERTKSKYKRQTRYKPGTIVPNGRFLLMAFAKLDAKGLGSLTYDEYLECLNTLWEQIDLYHGTDDVYLPIVGSNITRFDKDLTQQQLLDIMISSYRLSPKKITNPNKIHIICREREGFSLNNIFGAK